MSEPDLSDLPYRPHCGARCRKCNKICVIELLTPEDVMKADREPARWLRELPKKDRDELVTFVVSHSKNGCEADPIMLGIAELAKA